MEWKSWNGRTGLAEAPGKRRGKPAQEERAGGGPCSPAQAGIKKKMRCPGAVRLGPLASRQHTTGYAARGFVSILSTRRASCAETTKPGVDGSIYAVFTRRFKVRS